MVYYAIPLMKIVYCHQHQFIYRYEQYSIVSQGWHSVQARDTKETVAYNEQNSCEIKVNQVSGATWHTGTQRDKNNGCYCILDASRTPEVRSNISDDCCHHTHHNDAHKESCMALAKSCI
jgi:hypothetical protein